ncbi:sodium:solute symporter family protein [Pontibacter akesuensis]|uniref:Na+/proline symporter n=1 Tax=Pontibacter akesuensis TaxID=388950 RepID=A0A1I7KXS9_9BACT|nr:sodium:solute symporter family protein [Pontibacter akesuensis]GHA78457.1 sodium:solute symporter [Pontibacter akesuensis]SFV02227.1 Na+/proline symporter [Pontibacter akesuensis]
MKLAAVDIGIIVSYLVAVACIGLLLKNRAKQNKEAYLLGGNTLPWYALGLSNASGMFDISGTMWMVMLAFVYGLKSIWIPWLWPSFNQVFLMVFLGIWLRRSNVTTGAEWMLTRFGKTKSTNKSHAIVVVFALLSCLGFLAYGFIGLGKFVEIFIPWSAVQPYVPFTVSAEYVPHIYGLVFTLFAVFYSILGGMASIVWADVLQFAIITIGSIVVGYIAIENISAGTLVVPEGWKTPFFGATLDMDWTGIIDDVNTKIQEDGFSLFGIFFSLMLFKGVLASLAGPTPNYDMQKILSTRTPQDAAKMSGFVSLVLIPTRYLMIISFTVLALLNFEQLNLEVGGRLDYEQILPAAIINFAPTGILGLIVAGLLSAFIGTFAGTLNAAQAYIVNDVYLKYVNPTAPNAVVTSMNYLSGILVVVLSVVLGFFAKDVNSLLQWIVSGLYGGYIAANVLKWYWWRFNSNGFFWGMLSGITPALIFPFFFDGLDLYYFPVLLLLSLIGSIVGTLAAPPTDMETLKSFYSTVRPWGFWGPVDKLVKAENPGFRENKSFWFDVFNVIVGVVAQMSLTLLPIYLVIQMQTELYITLGVFLVCAVIMKKTWWDRLPNDSPTTPPKNPNEDKPPKKDPVAVADSIH